jgi:hypothetical protein
MRFLGYCARKKAIKRIIPIVENNNPSIPKNDIVRIVMSKTLTEAKKATTIIEAVAAKRKYWR